MSLPEILDEINSLGDTAGAFASLFSVLFAILSTVIPVLLSFVGTIGGAIVAILSAIVTFIGTVLLYLLRSIPLFIFARKAGNKFAWFAFIPYLNTYLMMTISLREFNLFNAIKTNKRGIVALIYIGAKLFGSTILTALLSIPGVNAISGLLNLLLFLSYRFIEWRMMYDVLKTARREEVAMPVAVIGTLIPIIYDIVFLFSCKREPEYGAGNYEQFRKDYSF